MPIIYICPKCGAIDWIELVGYSETHYMLLHGEIVRYAVRQEEVEIYCNVCNINIWSGELSVSDSEIRELEKMSKKDRLVYILKKQASGEEIVTDIKTFVEDILKYHSNDKSFIDKISPYLVSLGFM